MTPTDRLYSLPLGEFTAARNALAKDSGADGVAIKKLEKPSVPAWAVNQLYWHHRDVYSRLIAAAEKMRTVNKQAVAGKKADVAPAEKAHQAAIKAAMDTVRAILAASGEDGATPSSATLNAVSDTLHALPSKEPPGRLTKPLRLVGFEAFAGFAGLPAARPALVEAAKKPGVAAAKTAKHDEKAEAMRKRAEEREAEEREQRLRREKAKLEAQLAAARKKEQAAGAETEKSRRALSKAEQEQERLKFALSAATKEVDRLRESVKANEQNQRKAEGERAAIENELKNY